MHGSTDELDKILEKYKLTCFRNGVVEKWNGELDIKIHSFYYVIWLPE